LYRLQEVDLELDRIKGRLDEIKAILSESQELDQARIELEESLAHLKEAEAESRSAERFVASQRSKIEETDSKLYGGSITSPKELEDLQLEAMSLRRHLGTLEDRLLEAMMR
ncbi:MAG: hypothetical protein GTN65_15080, partial [Armatimonadetes bacterium]|nr:hypothetical protein [Armatimonadota bacterium]NIO98384.1 hypothetical protein [Armatimonadota bacterium]